MSNVPLGGFSVEQGSSTDVRVSHYRLMGKMTGEQREYAFLDSFRTELVPDSRLVAFDFSDVSYLNSSGIGVIAACLTAAKQQEVTVCFLGMSETVSDLFRVVGLLELAETHANIEEAIAAHPS